MAIKETSFSVPTSDSDVQTTVNFFQKWCPEILPKNFTTQLGVHFEEISEFIASLKGLDRITQSMLTQALVANHALALHLKAMKTPTVEIADRIEFIDGLCDQIVTAAGTGYMAGMDVPGAFGEVNRSNNSKFGENGEPILDENLKMVKGPNYRKADLTPFV